MFNFEICFERPWWLLLLIPAALLTFIPYFRIKKRYRRTSNRILSVVLHSLVMVLCVALLSGFYVRYYVPNEENEMILLVDVSDTGAGTTEKRDTFVETVIEECAYVNIRVGVVTFGFDQVYAVPMTYEYENAFDAYMDALDTTLPDTTATNIAGALEYAQGLFDHGYNIGIDPPAHYQDNYPTDYPWFADNISQMPYVYAFLGKHEEVLAKILEVNEKED